ncbi:hypothetical protein J6590_019109 [Homalodisca vitripennis]|nr:hypothetical protein J6590_019109 [Homalodisca vitripennis]
MIYTTAARGLDARTSLTCPAPEAFIGKLFHLLNFMRLLRRNLEVVVKARVVGIKDGDVKMSLAVVWTTRLPAWVAVGCVIGRPDCQSEVCRCGWLVAVGCVSVRPGCQSDVSSVYTTIQMSGRQMPLAVVWTTGLPEWVIAGCVCGHPDCQPELPGYATLL